LYLLYILISYALVVILIFRPDLELDFDFAFPSRRRHWQFCRTLRKVQELASSADLASFSDTTVGKWLDGDVVLLSSGENEVGEGGGTDCNEDENEGYDEHAKALAETTEKKKREQKQKTR
jgi:hypothetical protein